jgi:hypothetical protein
MGGESYRPDRTSVSLSRYPSRLAALTERLTRLDRRTVDVGGQVVGESRV